MTIVSVDQIREQLSFTPDMGTMDDALLTRKAEAAQGFIERQLGFRIEERFGGEDQDPVPPELVEAVCQLAAWWFESREAAAEGGAREVPFNVRDIIDAHRDWSF